MTALTWVRFSWCCSIGSASCAVSDPEAARDRDDSTDMGSVLVVSRPSRCPEKYQSCIERYIYIYIYIYNTAFWGQVVVLMKLQVLDNNIGEHILVKLYWNARASDYTSHYVQIDRDELIITILPIIIYHVSFVCLCLMARWTLRGQSY